MSDELKKGLRGVLVAESELSYIDGDAGKLVYRGYAIEDLAYEASFEETVYLLWHGHLPDPEELEGFRSRMAKEREISPEVVEALRSLVAADERPMAAVRTATSMLSAYDPEAGSDPEDLDASLRKGRRITARLPTVLAAYERIRNGEEPVPPREDLGYAANFLYMLTDEEPSDLETETFDMTLTLHADHGFNASTFTTMVIASTFADVYSAITGGIGALSGPLHGGANQDVMAILEEIDESGMGPREWIEDAMDEGRRIPGWGHGVYNVKDPRSIILQEKLEELSEESGNTKWLDYLNTIEEYLTEEAGLPERDIAPNVDFFSGSVYDQLDIPADMYTPIFAMSRAAGWLGHILEYQSDNYLIRPRAQYVGETEREWVPLEER